jgi:uncharacterized protein YjbI with pentapeptide repeats
MCARGDDPAAEGASIRKATLEAKVLERQLSKPYELREWLKALTGLAAIAALLAAFFQLQQNHYQRSEDRLERAISRLASPNTNERLAGVSTLRVFLDEGSGGQRRIALSALANSVAAETEPVVWGAILDVLKHADSSSRNEILEELANGSRGLLPAAMKKQPAQAFTLWLVDEGDFGRLQNLERAIVELLWKGARTNSLAGIYCVQCNFEGLDLRGTDFSGAVLNNASFKRSKLSNSSFEHAVMLSTSFVGADLRGAKFTVQGQNKDFASGAVTNGGTTPWGPDFTCANLENADFSGQALLSFVEEGRDFIAPGTFFTANFSNSNLAHADFRRIGVYGALIPKALPPSTAPGALGALDTWGRQDFPLPMDLFVVEDKPRETTIATLGVVKKASYRFFRGNLSPSLPIGSDLGRYAGSLKGIAGAFSNSNWNDAQLPNSLRQFLTRANVPVSRTNSCTDIQGKEAFDYRQNPGTESGTTESGDRRDVHHFLFEEASACRVFPLHKSFSTTFHRKKSIVCDEQP